MSTAMAAPPATVMDAFVVPRYLSHFGDAAMELLIPVEGARIAQVGCRTGYPLAELQSRLAHFWLIGIDDSPESLQLARHNARNLRQARADYHLSSEAAGAFEAGTFSHVLFLHPLAARAQERRTLASWALEQLTPAGQLLFAQPLRGSFQEIYDLLREFTLKCDAARLGKIVEAAAIARPTVESLVEELEGSGFTEVDMVERRVALEFRGGRDFFEDPVTRSLILPDMMAALGTVDMSEALSYVQHAIERYWAGETFELTLSIGCASARKPAGLGDQIHHPACSWLPEDAPVQDRPKTPRRLGG